MATPDQPSTLADLLAAAMAQEAIPNPRVLAKRCGIAYETARRALRGIGRTRETTLRRLARGLELDLADLRAAARVPVGEDHPFEWPPEFDRLTRQQRETLVSVGRALLDAASPHGKPNNNPGDHAPNPTPDGYLRDPFEPETPPEPDRDTSTTSARRHHLRLAGRARPPHG